MRADPDIPGSRATARPRPIVVPDLPNPLAYHFRRWEFLARNVDALGGGVASAASVTRLLALIVSIAVTIFAATCFEPVDQIALRVSRAWRKQK